MISNPNAWALRTLLRMSKAKEMMAIAGVLAGAGVLATGFALGVSWMFQAWLVEVVRLQSAVSALGRW